MGLDAEGPTPAGSAWDRIPKVELHCHVEGSVRSTTVVELARKAGRPLPVEDPTELYRYDSLDSFLSIFWLVQELLTDRDDWARIAEESLARRARPRPPVPRDVLHAGAPPRGRPGPWRDRRRADRGDRAGRGRHRRPMRADRRHGPRLRAPGGPRAGRGAGRAAAGRSRRARDRDRRRFDRARRRFPRVRARAGRGPATRLPAYVPRRRGRRRRPVEHRDRPGRPGRRADRPRGRDRRGPGARPTHGRRADPADGVPVEQRRHRQPVPVPGRAPVPARCATRASC